MLGPGWCRHQQACAQERMKTKRGVNPRVAPDWAGCVNLGVGDSETGIPNSGLRTDTRGSVGVNTD